MATKLYEARAERCRVAPLIFMSDPEAMADLINIIQNLPRHTTIIYRHFGKKNHLEEALILRQATFEKDQQLLIGADPALAIKVGADGVHFKRDKALRLPMLWKERCPEWVITMAGIKSGNYEGNLAVLDGLIISSVFPSKSPSAGTPIGVQALTSKIKTTPCPIFALGGINEDTAPHLIGSGAYGLAGIRGMLPSSTPY